MMKATEIMREGEHITEPTDSLTASPNDSHSGEVGGVDFSGLEDSVDRACATIDRLREQRDDLLAALTQVVEAVRQHNASDEQMDITDDGRETCIFDFHTTLAAADAAIAKADGR